MNTNDTGAAPLRLPIANIEGWLVSAVASPLRDAGDRAIPRSVLARMAPGRVGPTADSDGYKVAQVNGYDDDEGKTLIIGECLRLLREQGWVAGEDDALRWAGGGHPGAGGVRARDTAPVRCRAPGR